MKVTMVTYGVPYDATQVLDATYGSDDERWSTPFSYQDMMQFDVGDGNRIVDCKNIKIN